MTLLDDAIGVLTPLARLCGAVIVLALLVGCTAWAVRWAWHMVTG